MRLRWPYCNPLEWELEVLLEYRLHFSGSASMKPPNSPKRLNDWLVVPKANPKADVRLVMIPFAGAGPSAFHGWASDMPSNIEVQIVNLPGREGRIREPLITSACEMGSRLDLALGCEDTRN